MAPDSVSHQVVSTNGIRIHLAELGAGPLVLLCHGFPELWYSWRYQLPALAEAGYHAVAPDLRGYGQTDQPEPIEAYTLLHLVGDLVGLVEVLGEEQAILVGHDWGANLAWQAALLRPDRFPVLVTMSSPYLARGPLHGEGAGRPPGQPRSGAASHRWFYQTAFQRPGEAEAQLERDVHLTMRRFFYGLSADAAPSERWHPILPEPPLDPLNSGADPDHLPPWLSEADLDLYTAEFERTGFRGGLNWYRNTVRNWELLAPWSGARVLQPALFLCGEEDPILEVPGVSRAIQAMPSLVPQLQTILLPGSGHWVQQEKAREVNETILTFLQRSAPR